MIPAGMRLPRLVASFMDTPLRFMGVPPRFMGMALSLVDPAMEAHGHHAGARRCAREARDLRGPSGEPHPLRRR
jgi:hypothetical protein